jgi:hypothetical protein
MIGAVCYIFDVRYLHWLPPLLASPEAAPTRDRLHDLDLFAVLFHEVAYVHDALVAGEAFHAWSFEAL